MCSCVINAENEKKSGRTPQEVVRRPWSPKKVALDWPYGVFGNFGDGCLLGRIAGDQSGIPLLKVQNLKST